MLLYDSLKFSFVYQRAIFLILRLPQVNKNVLKFQICDYIAWSLSFRYDFGIIISVASKTTLRQNKETVYRQNWSVDLGLNLSAPRFSFPVQMLIFRSPWPYLPKVTLNFVIIRTIKNYLPSNLWCQILIVDKIDFKIILLFFYSNYFNSTEILLN